MLLKYNPEDFYIILNQYLKTGYRAQVQKMLHIPTTSNQATYPKEPQNMLHTPYYRPREQQNRRQSPSTSQQTSAPSVSKQATDKQPVPQNKLHTLSNSKQATDNQYPKTGNRPPLP